MNFADRFDQLCALRALQQIARCAGRQRIENVIRILVHCQHHGLNFRRHLLEPAHAFHAIDAWQVDVHQHYFGLLLRQRLERRLGRPVMTHTLKSIRAADHSRECLAQLLVVFDDGDSNWHPLAAVLSAGKSGVK